MCCLLFLFYVYIVFAARTELWFQFSNLNLAFGTKIFFIKSSYNIKSWCLYKRLFIFIWSFSKKNTCKRSWTSLNSTLNYRIIRSAMQVFIEIINFSILLFCSLIIFILCIYTAIYIFLKKALCIKMNFLLLKIAFNPFYKTIGNRFIYY
jgi:hypothetical protein